MKGNQRVRRTGSAPSPLVGEGWGGGSLLLRERPAPTPTPTPNPSPQGGGEQTEDAAIACINDARGSGIARRALISLLAAAAAWPLAARAQTRVRRIGVFTSLAVDDPATKARLAALGQELERLGWSQGRNLQLDYRFGAGRSDQYVSQAKELLALRPDAILTHSTPITATMQRETNAIPIVFTEVSDPIGSGFIASLARPGGNLTGMLLYEAGIVGKWLAMLKEIAPGLTRVAVLGNPKTAPFDYFKGAAEAAAPSLAVEIVPAPVANVAADIERAITSFAASPNGGLLVLPDPTTGGHRDLIVALTARHRLPAVYPFRLFVAAGGLMAYGTDQADVQRLAASYLDRILRGASPAELPVQAPTKYETLLNLKTANALGFDVPGSLLVRADEVIE
jgi:putative ABC transport system substrate-binding protein